MTFTNYQIDGKEYPCRIIKDNQGSELVIGSLELESVLHPGEFGSANDGFASKDAENIYDEIFFFTEPANLQLEDEALINILREDNPEWF